MKTIHLTAKERLYARSGEDGSYESYSVLYRDEDYIVVRNDATGKHSFGLAKDFHSGWFPVNQSHVSADEAVAVLDGFITVDMQYTGRLNGAAERGIARWTAMIEAIQAAQ